MLALISIPVEFVLLTINERALLYKKVRSHLLIYLYKISLHLYHYFHLNISTNVVKKAIPWIRQIKKMTQFAKKLFPLPNCKVS